MKLQLLILLLFSSTCFSQNNKQAQVEKPATDACPTWNKKNTKTSKAEYFQFLKSNKAKDKREVAYTASPSANSYSITRTTSVEPRTARGRRAKANSNTASKEESDKLKNKSNEAEDEQEETQAEQKKNVEEEKPEQPQEVVAKETVKEEKAVTAEDAKIESAKTKKDAPAINSEKLKKESKIAGRKVKRFFTRKNKGGKGKAAKCPDF